MKLVTSLVFNQVLPGVADTLEVNTLLLMADSRSAVISEAL